jgi:hypothetical protein
LGSIERSPWNVLAQMQTAWLPGRCRRPERDPQRQVHLLPATSEHYFNREQAFSPQLEIHLQAEKKCDQGAFLRAEAMKEVEGHRAVKKC